jgi:hypothetical protein
MYIALSALDPNCKLAYVEDKWDEEYVDAGKEDLERLVCNSSCPCS